MSESDKTRDTKSFGNISPDEDSVSKPKFGLHDMDNEQETEKVDGVSDNLEAAEELGPLKSQHSFMRHLGSSSSSSNLQGTESDSSIFTSPDVGRSTLR